MAAGFSRRFGDADKRRATLSDGCTLLAATLSHLQPFFSNPATGCRLAVVIRPEDQPDALAIPEDILVLRAPGAALGLGGSISDAVKTVLESPELSAIDSLAVLLGDMPGIKFEPLSALVDASGRDRIVRPRYQNQPGHPVLFGRDFWPEMLGLQGEEGARAVIKANGASLHHIDVEDSGVIADIDTPEQLVQRRGSR